MFDHMMICYENYYSFTLTQKDIPIRFQWVIRYYITKQGDCGKSYDWQTLIASQNINKYW